MENKINIDELYSDLKNHNFDETYEQKIVQNEVYKFFKNLVSEYPNYNEYGQETLMTMAKDTSFIEFDTLKKQTKFVIETMPYIIKLYKECLFGLEKKMAQEYYDKEYKNFSKYIPDEITFNSMVNEKYKEHGFKFRVPASKNILSNGKFAISNGFVQLDAYQDYFRLKRFDDRVYTYRKIPKSYDDQPYLDIKRELERDIIVQAFLQGYNIDEVKLSYITFDCTSLKNILVKTASKMLYDYGEAVNPFREHNPLAQFEFKPYTQNQATAFYSNPEKRIFTMDDANSYVREIMYMVTKLEKYAPNDNSTKSLDEENFESQDYEKDDSEDNYYSDSNDDYSYNNSNSSYSSDNDDNEFSLVDDEEDYCKKIDELMEYLKNR